MNISERPYKAGTPRGEAFDKGVKAVEAELRKAPATTAYLELQEAYDFFNRELFSGTLPNVMLAQIRKPNSLGYWAPNRWSAGEAASGELALHPDRLKDKSTKYMLSTLVHEQCHVWQTYHGKEPAGAYHDKQWANKMEEVGLMPSSTGAPGGKRTGHLMAHYIINGGAFERVCDALLARGFKFTWTSEAWGDAERKKTKGGKRAKYVCPFCEVAVWGKEELNIKCGECDETMEAA